MREIKITTFVDGEEPVFLHNIFNWWLNEWNQLYGHLGTITFVDVLDVKKREFFNNLPVFLQSAFLIRNPDLFFVAEVDGTTINLGGVEITTHSPDGSNVEKRYPFIWSGRKYNFNSFIVCPYMKVRANGQHNRLPNRHSLRNIEFADLWLDEQSDTFHQIIPVKELQPSLDIAESFLSHDLMTFRDITSFFCSYLAASIGEANAQGNLKAFVSQARSLASACAAVTSYTNPSSFWKDQERFVQVYNSRPDSGHWERGEGQFDSIDGRLMFTLDGMPRTNNNKLEFWMPQMSKNHPWVKEQVERGYGSKRFRNINVVLSEDVEVKFLEDLSDDDWSVLKNNQRLTLERKDWKPDFYRVKDLLENGDIISISRSGLKSPSSDVLSGIEAFLNSQELYLSTHRLYAENWEYDFVHGISNLPAGIRVIAPRISRESIASVRLRDDIDITFAEECTKIELMALRQLHRHVF